MENDTTIEGLLHHETNDNWQLIKENQIEALLLKLPSAPKNRWIKLFKRREPLLPSEPLHAIFYELFIQNGNKTLDSTTFSVIDQSSLELFLDLIRLLFSLAINGHYKQAEEQISNKLIQSSVNLSDEIEKKSNNYPANPINGQVWMGGAFLRTSFDYLAYYYRKTGDLDRELTIEKKRTRITLNIMSHYQALVFPDMLRIAVLEEQLNENEKALSRYRAVVADFEADNSLEDLIRDETELPDEELLVIYKAVITAYESRNRLEERIADTGTIAALKAVLAR